MLRGIELIDCAKANASRGVAYAAKQAGYQEDISLFRESLNQACKRIGVDISNLQDLVTDQQKVRKGVNLTEVSPDSMVEL